METKALSAPRRMGLGLALVIAIAVVPTVAEAAYLIPPGNSAANQYTESYPSAGGGKDVEGGTAGAGRSPANVLGSRGARRLEAHGPHGEATAELAAETAPATTSDAPPPQGNNGREENDLAGGAGGGDGSSGLGEVFTQATGLSSVGGGGPLLFLVILGAVAWAIAYLWRTRRSPDAQSPGSLP